MLRRGSLNFQTLLREVRRKVEFLFYWTISQILLVALGVFGIIRINFLGGGFHRFEKAVSYYELLWTSLPTVILCGVAGPRMCLLYLHEQEREPILSIKCVGHQWYWRYEYSDFEESKLDSFMSPTSSLEGGECRLLEVDHRAVFPLQTRINIYVTREDVIHSWALPIKRVKIDATPGRLNTVSLFFSTGGVLYGQCRELCGVNHRLIPIVVEVTSPSLFLEWLKRLN